MRKHVYILKSHEMWLGNPITLLFYKKKDANDYFNINCIGCGIITKATVNNAEKIDIKQTSAFNRTTGAIDADLLKVYYPSITINEGQWM